MRRFAPRDFELLPESSYNLRPRLKRLPRPPLHPATGEPLSPSDLEPLALGQEEVFRAGRLFLESEGVLPAPAFTGRLRRGYSALEDKELPHS